MAIKKANRKMSAKKKASAVMAGVLALALLIGGAFAWHDFSQSAINRSRGIVSPDVLLHDDFADEWVDGVREKDVYVENTGDIDTIVRIRFSEFLQIGNENIVGTNSKDVTTWSKHTFGKTLDVTTGLPTTGNTGGHKGNSAHEYFTWNMDGSQKVYLTDTSEMGHFEYDKADYTWTENHPITSTVDYTVEKGGNGQPYGETLAAQPPVTMDAWKTLTAGKSAAEINALAARWIVDTDGWCYWSKQLKPGEATNMLLDSVKMIKNPNDNYAYFIDVDLQACNETEINDMIAKGMTANAQDNLINSLIGSVKVDASTFSDPILRDAILNGFDREPKDGILEMQSIDTNGDGILSKNEMANVKEINLIGESAANRGALTSIEGLENFPNLTYLNGSYNNVSEIDLSQCPNLTRLDMRYNSLTEINLTPVSDLTHIWVFDNNISSLDVTPCPKIEMVSVRSNGMSELLLPATDKLSGLHVNDNPFDDADYIGWDIPSRSGLEALNISNTNITDVDVTNNPKLKELQVNGISSIDSIDVSNNGDLESLYINETTITSVDLSKNPKLGRLHAISVPLVTLDLKANPKIQYLFVNGCSIASLDISKTQIITPTDFRIQNNGMTALTVNAVQDAAGIGTHATWHLAGNTYGTATVAP